MYTVYSQCPCWFWLILVFSNSSGISELNLKSNTLEIPELLKKQKGPKSRTLTVYKPCLRCFGIKKDNKYQMLTLMLKHFFHYRGPNWKTLLSTIYILLSWCCFIQFIHLVLFKFPVMRNLKVSVTVQFTVYSVHCTMNRDTGHGPDKLETSGLAETSLATPV